MGGSFFVPVQIQPDFSLSHLLEEISTYFLKTHADWKESLDVLGQVVFTFMFLIIYTGIDLA